MTFPLGSSRPAREQIHEETLPYSSEAGEFDLLNARRCFSTLFDRAAQAVFRLGYDLDDVTIDRFIVLRDAQGAESEMEFSAWLRDVTQHTTSRTSALRARVFLESSA